MNEMMTVADLLGRSYSKSDFVFFWGHTDRGAGLGKNCLSQWYMAPMWIGGVSYNCMEQYLMAEKARAFGDDDTLAKIMAEYNQMSIKKLGRQVAGYDDEVWKGVRQEVSVRGNICKFAQNPALRDYLLSTGDKILVEASPRDQIWGIGLDENSPDALRPERWRGQNLLGFALMEARRHLRAIQDRLDDIIGRKDDDGPWPAKDFIEFCQGHRFTMAHQWTCEGLPYDSIKDALVASDARYASKIMIDMAFGPEYGMMPLMFFEHLHLQLDPIIAELGADCIFSLTPDVSEPGKSARLTLFY